MSQLLKTYILRNAERLPQKQISAIGIQSHPPRLRSDRFLEWDRACESRRYQEAEALMRRFYEGEEAAGSVRQLPPVLRKPLEFAEYNGYRFGLGEFLRHVEANELSKEFGRKGEDGRYPQHTVFTRAYTDIADRLLVEAKIPGLKLKGLGDKQEVLKTLHLLELAHVGREGRFDLNVEWLYAKPIILPGCLIDMDACQGGDAPHVAHAEPGVPPRGENVGGQTKPPDRDKCECKCRTECVPQDPCCAKITPYVADLYVVRDKVSCYEVGEMSYIENVLESEIRVRKHRHLEREELLTERTEEGAFSQERDHQADEKFSLQTEVAKTVEQELSLDAGVTFNYNWMAGSVAATTDTGYNISKKDAQSAVRDYSRQVLDKSITKLETKTRDFASRKFSRETEETNRHVFGGTDGAPADISRQFFYVNQVKEAQMFNYGRRMLLDLYLPEPSELYKHLLAKQFKLDKPEEPAITAKDITAENYESFIKTYDLKDVETPPEMTKTASIAFSGGTGDPKQQISNFQIVWAGSGTDERTDAVTVPDGYVTDKMTTDFGGVLFNGHDINSSLAIDIADSSLFIDSDGNSRTSVQMNPHEGTHTVKVSFMNTTEFNLTVIVTFRLKDEVLLKWQLSVYDKIIEAYKKELAAYEAALAEFEKYKQSKYRQNPFILLQEIQVQLKQAAIAYISCQFFDAMDAMKRKVEPCGFTQPNLPEAQREGEFVRFFEQAFEWKFMNFILYPYFWAGKCTWEEKFKEEADNHLFQQFLKAGFARVSISVRPGFEGHVGYFLKTRKIWGQTGQPPIAGPDFVPIYQEIKEDKDNFYADREGTLDVANASDTVALNGTDYYWEYGDPLATPFPIPAGVDAAKIAADIDREIIIKGKQYRIVAVQPVATPNSWQITLDRPYEGDDANNLRWSTGALFVGAPWEFRVPTRLVWLREQGRCLPCYPIECEEE